MSARSFTEAFGPDASAFPDDALSASYAITDLQHGCSTARYQEAIDTLTKSVPALIAQRDSARDWAVALEGENAQLEAKLLRVRRIAEADRLDLLTYGITRDAIFAALTGGEDA